jgi:hypothetical protein
MATCDKVHGSIAHDLVPKGDGTVERVMDVANLPQ